MKKKTIGYLLVLPLMFLIILGVLIFLIFYTFGPWWSFFWEMPLISKIITVILTIILIMAFCGAIILSTEIEKEKTTNTE